MKKLNLLLVTAALIITGCSQQMPTGHEPVNSKDLLGDQNTISIAPPKGYTPNPGAPSIVPLRKPAGNIIFDQGPSTGTPVLACFVNRTTSQNFAEQFSFSQTTDVFALNIFVCTFFAPNSGNTYHVKILSDAVGSPGAYLYEEDAAFDSVVEISPGFNGITQVTLLLSTPFTAAANTTYWIGASGNGFEATQHSIRTPGDGTMAQFSSRNFSFHAGVGDMMFQLLEAATITVDVDIKPGSDPNSINLKSKGVIPVAILTTGDFDATTVDGATVVFAGASPDHGSGHLEDVDGDGDTDWVGHFRTQDTTLDENSTDGSLTGQTTGGQDIEGSDSVRIAPGSSKGK